MCLAVPVRVISVDGTKGVIETGGLRRQVSLMLAPGLAVGDYVLVHAGFVIQKLDEHEAEETLRLFSEMAAESEAA